MPAIPQKIRPVRLAAAVAAIAFLLMPAVAPAAAPARAAAVLRQEARWLDAIVRGDRTTAATILTENFRHTTSRGKLLDREQELASMTKESFTMNPSGRIVDFAGDTAVVHGLNTLRQSGKTIARERYTDVYVNRGGIWMALAAQETDTAQ